jgi:hypothetical protein
MSQIRGSRLGGYSYEDDANVDAVPTRPATYICRNGHETTMAFAANAEEIPVSWDCRRCGQVAALDGIDFAVAAAHHASDPKAKGPGKTPWEMLTERRSIEELEALLDERLELLRGPLRASA